MQFGKVTSADGIDFTLPQDAAETGAVLAAYQHQNLLVYVGCAQWSRKELKGFYPKGVKDELTYYATQFNAVELNATYYKMPDCKQVENWKNKVPDQFKFFPKINNVISHHKRLDGVDLLVQTFCNSVGVFEEKLGTVFLQLHDNFTIKEFDKLRLFLNAFPKDVPLAVEVRNPTWFANAAAARPFFNLLKNVNITNVIVDTAGRRDILHMHLTTSEAFIRFVAINDYSVDITRLDDWVTRIKNWQKAGLQKLHFFIHQNVEEGSPLLAAYFIQQLNVAFNLNLKVPGKQNIQQSLFG